MWLVALKCVCHREYKKSHVDFALAEEHTAFISFVLDFLGLLKIVDFIMKLTYDYTLLAVPACLISEVHHFSFF